LRWVEGTALGFKAKGSSREIMGRAVNMECCPQLILQGSYLAIAFQGYQGSGEFQQI
jgi:hypothetical protein